MALPSSGQLTLNQIHIEAGGSSGTQVTLNDSDVRGLISKGDGSQNAINEYYGASSTPAHTDDFTTTVGQAGANTFYYMTAATTYSPSGNTATNLYYWNSTTVTMKFGFNLTVSPATFSTFGQSGSNGGAQNPASIADNSGHVHDHVAYCYDGGDGYARERLTFIGKQIVVEECLVMVLQVTGVIWKYTLLLLTLIHRPQQAHQMAH